MKKLLSILLTVMMLASVFMVPANAFVPEREILFLPENVFLNQDYSDASKTDFTTMYHATAFGTPVVGDGVVTIDTKNHATYRSAFVSDANIGTAKTITVEFDATVNQDIPVFTKSSTQAFSFCFGSGTGYGLDTPWMMEFYPSGLAKNTVITYKFTLQLDANTANDLAPFCVSAYEKRGSESLKALEYYGAYYPKTEGTHTYRIYKDNYSGTSNAVSRDFSMSSKNNFTLGTLTPRNCTSAFTTAPVVTFDNVKIYKEAGSAVAGTYSKKVGVSYSNDFETNDSFLTGGGTTDITVTQKKVADGNGYWELAAKETNMSVIKSSTSSAFGPNKTITVDLQCVSKGTPLLIYAGCPSGLKNDANDYMGINILNVPDNNWYTYKIEVGNFDSTKSLLNDHEEIIDVYRKPLGAADSSYVELSGVNIDPLAGNIAIDNAAFTGKDYGWGSSITRTNDIFILGYYHGRYNQDTAVEGATKWNMDNFQIRDSLAYTGEYTATDADLFVESNENNEVVIMASYENDTLKDVKFTELDGSNNKVDLSVTAGAETKIFIWNKLAGGKPILANPIEI